ncbi:hypothetical protein ACOSP7_005094 [Xanthoceras sorbifolium]
MAKLKDLRFDALTVDGDNYLSWIIDAELRLKSECLYDTIEEGNESSEKDKSTAMVILRHHLHQDLKAQYLTITEPEVLWQELKDRYNHQSAITLPNARYEWQHLRFQDYKSVSQYNSAMFRITTKLKLCGEDISDKDMLEKTFTTFHASNILLQQQYRERRFTKYSQLIACLLVAEKNNELLLKVHESRPTGSSAFPEVNANHIGNHQRGYNNGFDYNRGRGRNRGCGRGNERGNFGRGTYQFSSYQNFKNTPQKWNVYEAKQNKGKTTQHGPIRNDGICFRCGSDDHWSRTCRTPKHLVDLYQASLKEDEKGKKVETNLVDNSDHADITHLDVSDFFDDPKRKH